jgi:hypothetical protein
MAKDIPQTNASVDAHNMENSCATADDSEIPQELSPTPNNKMNPTEKLRSAIRSPERTSNCTVNIEKGETRNAKFSSTVHICLVLSRAEMKPLMSDLFWKAEEYGRFKNDAINELRAHLTANGITAKEAIFEMYQPHDHERQQWLAEYGNAQKSDSDSDSVSTQTASDTDDEYLHDLDDILNIEDNDELRNAKNMATIKHHELSKDIDLTSVASNQRSNQKSVSKQHDWAVSWRPKCRSIY